MNNGLRPNLNATVALSIALLFPTSLVHAHQDAVAPLAKSEKTYTTPRPIGNLKVTYTAPQPGKDPALLVACDLFQNEVPAKALTDLPRPDWDRYTVAYSLTSFESGQWTNRPYLFVQVQLHGPPGKPPWEGTWVLYHFNAEGKLTRYLKRHTPNPTTNSIRSFVKEWPIDANMTAESIFESANNR